MKKSLIIGTVLVIIIGIILPSITLATNCGGNSAASSVCKSYVFSSINIETGRFVGYEGLNESQRTDVKAVLRNHWIKGMTYKILKELPNSDKSEIVILCERPYRRAGTGILSKIMSITPGQVYAVGYSDGSTGYLEKDEIAKFGSDKYISVDPW